MTGAFVISQEVLQRNIAPTTVSQVREAGESPVRLKMKLMEPGNRDMAIMIVSLMKQFYTDDMFVRMLGTDDSTKIGIRELRKIKDVSELRYDIQVGLPAEVPLSRVRRFQQIVEAVNAGALNPNVPLKAREALLDASNFPNKGEILKEMRERDMMQKQVEVANAQAQVMTLAAQAKQAEAAINPPEQPDPLQSTNPAEVEQALSNMDEQQLAALMGQR